MWKKDKDNMVFSLKETRFSFANIIFNSNSQRTYLANNLF